MLAAHRLTRLLAHPIALRRVARSITTTADLAGSTSTASTSSPAKKAAIPLSNVEAQYALLSPEEKLSLHERLDEIQKRDWKELSIDEKKAAYYVAFGPHGTRAPTGKPGDGIKIFALTLGLVGVAGALFMTVRSFGGAPPKTITKEWEEAANVRALEMKLNPISGISSEGYSGKGFVVSK